MVAKEIKVPRTRIERLVKEQTAVTVDTALRLAALFETTPEFWLNMQLNYDLAAGRRELDVAEIPAARLHLLAAE
ncbi:addiction module antidote protein, HigA family [Ketogulonicigenium robustum]|uniref:Addiction module antidote protein, HigA family n=1 Tax=Ketogulonicigenium robustum TaxID=92947 RepID=A0A1W6NZ41_9RHOB|nr:addiction module antidote protein, HigA family [Ketogulonicigenium robustum]